MIEHMALWNGRNAPGTKEEVDEKSVEFKLLLKECEVCALIRSIEGQDWTPERGVLYEPRSEIFPYARIRPSPDDQIDI